MKKIKILENIREENSIIYNNELQIKKTQRLDVFLQKIIDGDKKFLESFLLNEYEGKAIFKNLSSQQFINTLSHTSNKTITELGYILHARYFERYSCDLIDELSFWKDLKDDFEYKKEEGLRKHLLKQFKKYRIDEIIEKLEKCNINA